LSREEEERREAELFSAAEWRGENCRDVSGMASHHHITGSEAPIARSGACLTVQGDIAVVY